MNVDTFLQPMSGNLTYTAVAIVLSGAVLMCLWLYRHQFPDIMEAGSTRISDLFVAPKQPMVGIHNPFVVELLEAGQQDHNFFAKLKCNCTLNCIVHGYWGMNIKKLFELLYRLDGKQFVQKMHCKHLVPASSFVELDCSNCISQETTNSSISQETTSDTEKILCFKSSSSVLKEKLVESPRACYPLVVIAALDQDNMHIVDSADQSQIIALVTVIHIQDELCEKSSQIMMQYIKLASGQIFPLKSLFMAREHGNSSSNSESQHTHTASTSGYNEGLNDNDDYEEEEGSHHDCTVCQSAPITTVMLPCRHACVCGDCFRFLRNCPMCRGYIEHYFLIGADGRDYEQDLRDDFENTGTWFERLNHKLNRWLGFE